VQENITCGDKIHAFSARTSILAMTLLRTHMMPSLARRCMFGVRASGMPYGSMEGRMSSSRAGQLAL
jgi:hypothetical protein